MSTVVSRHLASLAEADAAATAALYAESGRLVALDGVAEGRQAIASRYQRFFDYHGEISSVEVLAEQADGAGGQFVRFALQSVRGRFELLNVYLVEGDLIERHFSNETRAEVAADAARGDAQPGTGDAAPGGGSADSGTAGDHPTPDATVEQTTADR